MTGNIRIFEPGDATRYRYSVQYVENEYGVLSHFFSFGVGGRPMVSADFPVDNFVDFYYFMDKFGMLEKNLHTIYVGYVVFCMITNRRADGHQHEAAHDRAWRFDWSDILEYDLGAVPV